MAKRIVVFSSSYRRGGNSETLAASFVSGALDAGNTVEMIVLRDHALEYCQGCGYCSSHEGHCFQKDDGENLVSKMKEADVIVLATPTYFYSMAGQLKTLIDRSVMAYPLKDKVFYYLITSQDSNRKLVNKVVTALRGFSVDCCQNTSEGGIILATGVDEPGAISGSKFLQKAFEMGNAIH